MRVARWWCLGLVSSLLLCAAPAQAHIVSSRLGDFYGGALHPLTALPDVILWVALGMLAAFQRLMAARWLAVLFPLGLAAGLELGRVAGWAPELAWLDAVLMVALGSLVAGAVRLPASPFLFGATAVATYRGLCNASGVTTGSDALLFAAGTAAAGYAAITLLMAGAVAFRRTGTGWQDIAVRAGGSWIAAIGVMVGGLAVAGL